VGTHRHNIKLNNVDIFLYGLSYLMRLFEVVESGIGMSGLEDN
jgi:hypothetical protein